MRHQRLIPRRTSARADVRARLATAYQVDRPAVDDFGRRVDEHGTGADEGDQVWGVDGAPAVLGGLDELERHRQPGRA